MITLYHRSRRVCAPVISKIYRYSNLSYGGLSCKSKAKQNPVIGAGCELFAVILYANEQYKMAPNDILMLPRLSACIGQEIAFKKCLMIGGEKFTAIGRPFLENARVTGIVEEHKKSHNVIYYLDRHKRKNIQWKNAQHQVTIIRVQNVQYEPEFVGPIEKSSGQVVSI